MINSNFGQITLTIFMYLIALSKLCHFSVLCYSLISTYIFVVDVFHYDNMVTKLIA